MMPENWVDGLFPLLGVVTGGLLTHLSAHGFYKKDSQARKKRSAVYLASHFHLYAVTVATAVLDTISDHQDNDTIEGNEYSLPEFPTFPDTIDFALIDNDLSVRALAFEADLAINNYMLKSQAIRQTDNWERFNIKKMSKIGLEADDFAKEVRLISELPDPNPERLGWDYRSILEKRANNKIG